MADVLRQRRGPLRGAFTKISKSLEEYLSSADPAKDELAGMLALFEEKVKKLDEVQQEILAVMQRDKCTQEEYNAEYESGEVYTDRGCVLKAKAARTLRRLDSVLPPGATKDGAGGNAAERRKYRLPEIELRKFDGAPKEWLGFWGQFSKIHEDAELDDQDKYQYLIQATVANSKARELIESYPPTAENYKRAVEQLTRRFGRPEILVEVYVRELLRLVLDNALSHHNKENVAELYDKLETQLRALETLGVTKDKYASMLYPLVESCLPGESLRVWERYRMGPGAATEEAVAPDRLTALMSFLRNEVEGEERIRMAKAGFGLSQENKRKPRTRSEGMVEYATAAGLFTVQTKGNPSRGETGCVFCGKAHPSKDCRVIAKWSFEDKKRALEKAGCCFACLRTGHQARACRSPPSCPRCSRRHYEILCRGQSGQNKDFGENFNPGVPTKESVTLNNVSCSPEVLLQTLTVILQEKDKDYPVRALIDTGSQRSYITKKAATVMGYQSLGTERLAHLLFGGETTTCQEHRKYRVFMSSVDKRFLCNFEVLEQEIICGEVPRIPTGPWLEELKERGVKLTAIDDAETTVGDGIEILIGADVAGKLLGGRTWPLPSGPVAMETRLGWVLMGKLKQSPAQESGNFKVVRTLLNTEAAIADLWKLDSLGILDPSDKQSRAELHEAAVEHFNQTVQRTATGRYEVSLPWEEGHPTLSSNRDIALKRLAVTTRNLMRMGRLTQYQEVLKEWESEGIVEEVSTEGIEGHCHYLPHRAVIKDTSETTKIRPVFDASSRRKDQPSLNQCLVKGPNLIELIPAVLTRFRWKRIGVTSDIRKAFLQIGVQEGDRDFLRFLWFEDGNPSRLRTYRHKRVVFGVTSSPFLLAATLSHHLQTVPTELEESAVLLSKSLYVDNCLTSLDNEVQLEKFRQEATDMLSLAQMDLRGWRSNCTDEVSGGDGDPEVIPVLGLNWNLKEDTLSCVVNPAFDDPAINPVTKRVLLSSAHRLFDPIGFTSPAALLPKMQLQKAWELKVGWDEELPEPLVKPFRSWHQQLYLLREVKIPRWVLRRPYRPESVSLHVFCDASKSAYATCIFLREEGPEIVSVQLLSAKNRVAPLKLTTIPRLELLACCIGARLAKSVAEELPVSNIPTRFWTDSGTALCWIKSEDQWGTFVWNRVREIRTLSNPEDWNHVPGVSNPADLPSRGCSPQQLSVSRWWEGPDWLRDPSEKWPVSEGTVEEKEVASERRKTVVSTMPAFSTAHWSSRYSSYWKIVRLHSWIYRFVHNARSSLTRREGPLTGEEIDHAEGVLLRSVQNETFCGPNDQRLRSFQIVQDPQGTLRVTTSLLQRKDTSDFKYPIVLPNNHPIVELLLRMLHLQMCHGGVQVMCAGVRERFWILNGRKVIRKIIRQCGRCRRFDAKPRSTPPASLPLDRIRDAAVFETTGIDLAGPLYLRGGSKVWVVLFTCAVYRAVHLELVASLSTEAFLRALRRFVARRGRPLTIYTDNGTNFVGANNAFRDLDWQSIHDHGTMQRIVWRFSPPSAAWWGGWWERLIGLLKRILRRVLGKALLTREELETVLCDCEGVMNSRPLTYVHDDGDALTPLTPASFMRDLVGDGVPEMDALDHDGLNRRQRHCQSVRRDLRRRFRSEYLAQLRQPKTKGSTKPPLDVGDIVLVGDDNVKRTEWRLARILETYPGHDRQTRVCKVRTAVGELVRPVRRLYPMEVRPVKDKTPPSTPEHGPKESLENNGSRTRSGRRIVPPERLQVGLLSLSSPERSQGGRMSRDP